MDYCWKEVLSCTGLSLLYVASLYIWSSPQERDHPSTIKKRCISVFLMTGISPLFVLYFLNEETATKASLWTILGLRTEGILPSTVLSLLLTFILFLGPIVQSHFNTSLHTSLFHYLGRTYWSNTFKNAIWWRNQVVAPFSEEFTFRVCMLPVLLQCLSPVKAIFIAPLFFGIAHLHHAIDRIRKGIPPLTVFVVSLFQFMYTSIFGFYSAFLFIRTGHFLPLFVVHSFCNHMGLPDLQEALGFPFHLRILLLASHMLGLALWLALLFPLTEPSFFSNSLYKL